MRRSYLVLAMAPALMVATGCGGSGDGGSGPTQIPTTVDVSSPSTDSLVSMGETRQLTVVVRDQNNAVINSPSVTWSSSATGIATVSSSGLVTVAGAGPGSAWIRASSGSAATGIDSVQVHVRQRLHHVLVTPGTATIAPSATRTLTATGQDARNNNMAALPAASWGTSNDAIASVSTAGVVTGVANGGPVTITATITSAADGAKQGTSLITVATPIPVHQVTAGASTQTFTPSTITIAPGDTVAWSFGALMHNVQFAAGTPAGAPAPPSNIGNSTNTVVKRKFPTNITTTTTYDYECGLHPGMTGSVIVQP